MGEHEVVEEVGAAGDGEFGAEQHHVAVAQHPLAGGGGGDWRPRRRGRISRTLGFVEVH